MIYIEREHRHVYGDVLLLIYMCVIERDFVNIKYAEALGCLDRLSYYSMPDMVVGRACRICCIANFII